MTLSKQGKVLSLRRAGEINIFMKSSVRNVDFLLVSRGVGGTVEVSVDLPILTNFFALCSSLIKVTLVTCAMNFSV